MANVIPFTAQPRDPSLTSKALRRADKIPGVMYGRTYQAVPLQFDFAIASRLVREAGKSRLVSVVIEGGATAQDAFIRDVQRDPVSGRVIHLDLYAVMADQLVTNFVPLVTGGRAPVLDTGALVVQLLDRVEVECLPRDMPASIAVDLTKIVDLHSHLTLADLVIPAGVKLMRDASTEVVHAVMPAIEVEETPAEEVAAAATATTATAGAPAAGAAAGTPATPEAKPGKAEVKGGKADSKPGRGEAKPEKKK